MLEDKARCFGCGGCAAACPAGAITLRPDAEGFLYPTLDTARCLDCGACAAACPARQPLAPAEGQVWAVRCRDEQLLQKSTSGGAFSLLAEEVLAAGGAVCGAGFDQNFYLRHFLSEDIASMRKSKYVQSDLGDSFAAVAGALRQGRPVLFCGTPCQCHAIKLSLGPAAESLTLAALVCRGVCSPGLWAEYVAFLSQDGPLAAYDFRDKRRLDDAHTVAYTVGGRETASPMSEDRFSRIYNKALPYRPSCYSCPYSRLHNDFDFTLGDFWGIGRIHPALADGRGTSLVIARGARAAAMMQRIAARAEMIPCTAPDALQPALEAPARQTLLRRLLFQDFAKKDAEGRCDMPLILKKYGA